MTAVSDGYAAYTRHVNPALGRFLQLAGRDLRLVGAKGCVLVDESGRRFDDWVAGFGSFNLGHNPDAVIAAVRQHLTVDAPNLFVENLNPFAGRLAERLVAAAGPGFEVCFFSNSGAEGIEAALKTALLATARPRIAYAEGGYHGTTLGALACMARGLYRDPFANVLADFISVPWNDLAALERTLAGGDVAGFLVEPIQAEGGMRIAGADYLRGARELTRRHGALLLFDEIQTGMGRTGELFAFHGAAVIPDLFVVAKSLGGGVMPIAATVCGEGIWQRAFGDLPNAEIHASTFGGNALACVAALASLELTSDRGFLDGVTRRGEELFGALHRALDGLPLVRRLSHRGLLGGLEIAAVDHPWLSFESFGVAELAGRPVGGALLMERLLRKGILAQVCGHDWSVLRIEPPLTVDSATCARFVDAVTESVGWLSEMGR